MEWFLVGAVVGLIGLAGWELREIGRLKAQLREVGDRLVDARQMTEAVRAATVVQEVQIKALERRRAVDPADLVASLAGLSARLDDLDDLRATLRRVADQNRKQLDLAAAAAR